MLSIGTIIKVPTGSNLLQKDQAIVQKAPKLQNQQFLSQKKAKKQAGNNRKNSVQKPR